MTTQRERSLERIADALEEIVTELRSIDSTASGMVVRYAMRQAIRGPSSLVGGSLRAGEREDQEDG